MRYFLRSACVFQSDLARLWLDVYLFFDDDDEEDDDYGVVT